MRSFFLGYRCSICHAEYSTGQLMYTCPVDGGNLDVVLDLSAIRQKFEKEDITSRSDPSLWRYLPLLPVDAPASGQTPLHTAGWTPIYWMPGLAEKLGIKSLWIKDEGRNPTASFKDRASAVVVINAQQTGFVVVTTASTGYAGAALAGMAAAIGQRSIIFAPRTAPPAKIAQLLIYGAQVFLVDGNYDQAFDLVVEAAQTYGWYCRNTGYNPFTIEGKKTAAFEIWEQIIQQQPRGSLPLTVFVSVGDGNIISGLHKGFKELHDLGWLEQMPRLIGVQAVGSAAVANAYTAGVERIEPVHAVTLADSISVNLPRDGIRALRAARETGGDYLTVTDQDILLAMKELGARGIFAEPAGAAGYAGLELAYKQGKLHPDDPVLVLNTGNGLKDVKAAMQAVDTAPVIEPNIRSLEKILLSGK